MDSVENRPVSIGSAGNAAGRLAHVAHIAQTAVSGAAVALVERVAQWRYVVGWFSGSVRGCKICIHDGLTKWLQLVQCVEHGVVDGHGSVDGKFHGVDAFTELFDRVSHAVQTCLHGV